MAISFVTSFKQDNNSGTTISIPLNGGGVADDLAIVYARADAGGATPPVITIGNGFGGGAVNSWTELVQEANTTGRDRKEAIFYKFLTGDNEVNSNISTDISEAMSVTLHVFRGVDTSSAFDATYTRSDGADNSNPTPDAITTVTNNSAILCLLGLTHDDVTAVGVPSIGGTAMTLGEAIFGAAEDHKQQMFAYLLDAGSAGLKSPTAWSNTITRSIAEFSSYTLALRDANPSGGAEVTGTLDVQETGQDTAIISGNVLVSGSIAVEETGSDTVNITGTVTDPSITGTLSVQEVGQDTVSISGDVAISGSLAATETGSDTASLTGTVAITGALAAQETGIDAAIVSGTVAITGVLSAQETGEDTASITGVVTPAGITGVLSVQEEGSDAASISGGVLVSGAIAVTETGQDTMTASGVVLPIEGITGTIVVQEAGTDTASITGEVLPLKKTGGSGKRRVRRYRPTVYEEEEKEFPSIQEVLDREAIEEYKPDAEKVDALSVQINETRKYVEALTERVNQENKIRARRKRQNEDATIVLMLF